MISAVATSQTGWRGKPSAIKNKELSTSGSVKVPTAGPPTHPAGKASGYSVGLLGEIFDQRSGDLLYANRTVKSFV